MQVAHVSQGASSNAGLSQLHGPRASRTEINVAHNHRPDIVVEKYMRFQAMPNDSLEPGYEAVMTFLPREFGKRGHGSCLALATDGVLLRIRS